jgi:hypothetical protein
MNSGRKAFLFFSSSASSLATAPPALAAIPFTRAELNATRLRVEGGGAVPNASVSIDGTVMGQAEGAGSFRIERDPFTSSTCTITVSDGATSTSATLAGCTPRSGEDQVGGIQIVRGGTGEGRVTSEPAGIDCNVATGGPRSFAPFPTGTRVKLEARAAPGSEFRGWGSDQQLPRGGQRDGGHRASFLPAGVLPQIVGRFQERTRPPPER